MGSWRRFITILSTAALVGAGSLAVQTAAAEPDPPGRPKLEVYVGTVDAGQLEQLRAAGVDPDDGAGDAGRRRQHRGRGRAERAEAARLAGQGVKLAVKGSAAGRRRRCCASRPRPAGTRSGPTASPAASATSWSRPRPVTRLAKLVDHRPHTQGKPILAVKVTKNARTSRDGAPGRRALHRRAARPRVDHAEMNRRLLHHVLDNYGTDPRSPPGRTRTELWFVPVANPDGYDYTFTEGNRLWRKNLRDNNGDGQITARRRRRPQPQLRLQVGLRQRGLVARPGQRHLPRDRARTPSRRPRRWTGCSGGSASSSSSTTTRPPSCCSTASAGRSARPAPDDEIYKAMAGDDAHPAVPGYDPDISAELYTTNGDTDTHAHGPRTARSASRRR